MTSISEDRQQTLSPGLAVKVPCTTASTGVLVLNGEKVVDGVACVSGDRVLVKNQASSVDNGIYIVSTGAWSRAQDFDGNYDTTKGTLVLVNDGSSLGRFYRLTTTDKPIVIGTSAITFELSTQVPVALASFPQIVDSIAALKALANPAGSAVTYLVRGYYAAGDGGGGLFRWNVADATADNGGTVIAPNAGAGRWNRIIDQENAITVKWFGAKSDGATNDAAAIQAALTYAAANKLIVKGSGISLISSALNYAPVSGGGIDWESTAYGAAGLLVSGAGYTALTVSAGTFSVFNLSVYGTLNTANGLVFNNPQLSKIQNAIAYNLDGFGVQINQAYDCVFENVSANLCGNATNYAVSVNDGANFTNHSHFLRIQSEQANKRALSISPNTTSCQFDAIHSERLAPDAAHTAWILGGVACGYSAVRLNSSGASANAKCLLEGTLTTFIALRAEGNIPVQVEADGGTSLSLIEPTISGTLAEFPAQIGKIRVYGGSVAALSGATPNILHYGDLLGAVVQDAISFIPVVKFGGSAVGITYSRQIGWARVVGDICEGAINITLTNKGAQVGAATITGLPLTNKNAAGQFASVHVGFDTALTYAGHVVMYIAANSSTISISQINAGAETGLTDAAFANATQLMLNFKFQVER